MGMGLLLGKCRVPIVRLYKHLGGLIDPLGSMGPEVASRRGQASEALAPLKRRVIGCPGLLMFDKLMLGPFSFTTLVCGASCLIRSLLSCMGCILRS